MTTENINTLISAQVILYPNDRIGEKEAQQCEQYFQESGFELGYRFADSFAITASVDTFNKVFDCNIISDEHGTHCDTGTDSIDYELPIGHLYDDLRVCIKAVTFSAPPDFGPNNF